MPRSLRESLLLIAILELVPVPGGLEGNLAPLAELCQVVGDRPYGRLEHAAYFLRGIPLAGMLFEKVVNLLLTHVIISNVEGLI